MNKTLYVRKSDTTIWEEAEKRAREGISPLVTSLLAEWVRQRKVREDGMERIEVETFNNDGGKPVINVFVGRWIYRDMGPYSVAETKGGRISWIYRDMGPYSVAETKGGRIIVWCKTEECSTLTVYEDFEDLSKEDILAPNIIAAIAGKLRYPDAVELDI